MQTGNANTRHVGVKIPTGQLYDKSDNPALTIEGLLELKFYAVQYANKKGSKVSMLVMKAADGTLYEAPNGDSWLNGAKQLSEQMKKNVEVVLSSAPRVGASVTVPTQDAVDVLAEEIATEVPSADPATAG